MALPTKSAEVLAGSKVANPRLSTATKSTSKVPARVQSAAPAQVNKKISTKGAGSATSLSGRDMAAGAKAMTMGTVKAVSKAPKKLTAVNKPNSFTPIKARKAAFLK